MDSILTVTTPATGTGFDLTSVADVKADLDITASTWDTLLGRYVTEASIAIANTCGRVFAKETVSEMFRRPPAPDVLMLRRYPVVSIAAIYENGSATPLAGADYEVDKAAGLLFRLSGDRRTCWTAEKVVVAYEGGYALPASAPADLQKAARILVKGQWVARKRDPALRSEKVEDVGEKVYWVGNIPGAGDAWPAEVEELLASYHDARVP